MAHTLDLIPDVMLRELFCRVAELGAGVELNFIDRAMTPQVSASVYRHFETAKACGCKFYFGSDAHHPAELAGAKANFTAIAAVWGSQRPINSTLPGCERSPHKKIDFFCEKRLTRQNCRAIMHHNKGKDEESTFRDMPQRAPVW